MEKISKEELLKALDENILSDEEFEKVAGGDMDDDCRRMCLALYGDSAKAGDETARKLFVQCMLSCSL